MTKKMLMNLIEEYRRLLDKMEGADGIIDAEWLCDWLSWMGIVMENLAEERGIDYKDAMFDWFFDHLYERDMPAEELVRRIMG